MKHPLLRQGRFLTKYFFIFERRYLVRAGRRTDGLRLFDAQTLADALVDLGEKGTCLYKFLKLLEEGDDLPAALAAKHVLKHWRIIRTRIKALSPNKINMSADASA